MKARKKRRRGRENGRDQWKEKVSKIYEGKKKKWGRKSSAGKEKKWKKSVKKRGRVENSWGGGGGEKQGDETEGEN